MTIRKFLHNKKITNFLQQFRTENEFVCLDTLVMDSCLLSRRETAVSALVFRWENICSDADDLQDVSRIARDIMET